MLNFQPRSSVKNCRDASRVFSSNSSYFTTNLHSFQLFAAFEMFLCSNNLSNHFQQPKNIFFSIFFSKTALISLKNLPKQPITTFHLKSRLPYNHLRQSDPRYSQIPLNHQKSQTSHHMLTPNREKIKNPTIG